MDYAILKQYAKDVDLTHKELADILECHQTWLSGIINNKKNPGRPLIRRIKQLLVNYKPYKDQQEQGHKHTQKPINDIPEKSVFFKTVT